MVFNHTEDEEPKHRNPIWTLLLGYGAILLLIILIAMMGSCSVERKIRKAQAVAYQFPDSFAKVCSTLYPPKDSVGKPTIQYLPANNQNYTSKIDSLSEALKEAEIRSSADTSEIGKKYRGEIGRLKAQVDALRKAYKPCEPDTLYVTNTVYRENTARVKDLELKLASVTKDYNEMEVDRDKWKEIAQTRLYWLLGLGGLIVVYLGLKFWIKIPFL